MNTTIEKLRKVRDHDKEVRRKYDLQPRQKLLSFKAWLARKNALGEAVEGPDVVESVMITLPHAASEAEKIVTAEQVAKTVIQLAAVGDVTVTAVATAPTN